MKKKHANNKKKVFILGAEGFPTGGARIEKLKIYGKALLNEDIDVHFISNAWCRLDKGKVPNKGIVEGLTYHYSCGITYRPKSFLSRRLVKFCGKSNEYFYLLTHKCDAAIISMISGMFFPLLTYWLISKIKGFRIYYPHHEDERLLKNRGLYKKLNFYLFNKFAWKMIDGVFPITSYLEQKIKEKNKGLPTLLIPAMVDFSCFAEKKKEKIGNYFLYCGALSYYDAIEFLIKSFELLKESDTELYLVCFSDKNSQHYVETLDKRVQASTKRQNIKKFDFMTYENLVDKYINAKALLIPLKNNIRDTARFPHKIGEYTASANPIITTNVGDISMYFKHQDSALIASEYNETEFASLMKFVDNNPEKAIGIGKNGFVIGQKYFDYKSYSVSIAKFMGLKK